MTAMPAKAGTYPYAPTARACETPISHAQLQLALGKVALAQVMYGASQSAGERMDAATLFENTMDWLCDAYGEHRFFVERDIVWTAQLRLLQEVEQANLPYRVLNDYTLFRGNRADLALLNGGAVEVAAEFKYEPSHARGDEFGPGKFPVVAWTGEGSVAKDVQRVHDYAAQGNAKTAYAVFIDEGGYFRHRDPHPGSEWRDWDNGVWALWTKVGETDSRQQGEATGGEETHEGLAHDDWVPLPQLNVNLQRYPRSPARLRFPDDHEHPVKSWKDMLYGTACWLASVCKLTERDAPVPVDARQPQARQRYIVSASSVHGSGKPFDEPFSIPDTTLVVETMVDKAQAKAYAINSSGVAA